MPQKRYAYSGVAYTAAKSGFDFEWCKSCDIGLPRADLVCFMDTRALKVDERDTFGEERYENVKFQSVVYANFKRLFGIIDDSHQSGQDDGVLVLNAKEKIDHG